jgi:hypothetical protein
MKNKYSHIEKDLSPDNFISKNVRKGIKFYKKDGYFYSDILFFYETSLTSGEAFEYQINSQGFRGKDFSEFNDNNINILFGGCSQTLGVGLPEKNTWYSKLSNKIKLLHEGRDVDFYNVGVNGGGIDLTIKNVIAFIRSGKIPDYLFLFLPESSRTICFEEKTKKFQPYLLTNPRDEDKDYYSNKYIHENKLLTNFMLLSMLEEICKFSGIKLLWTTWWLDDNSLYSNSSFNNFFAMSKELPYHVVLEKEGNEFNVAYFNEEFENNDNESYWHVARDGSHYGSAASNFIAESFMKELNRVK